MNNKAFYGKLYFHKAFFDLPAKTKNCESSIVLFSITSFLERF